MRNPADIFAIEPDPEAAEDAFQVALRADAPVVAPPAAEAADAPAADDGFWRALVEALRAEADAAEPDGRAGGADQGEAAFVAVIAVEVAPSAAIASAPIPPSAEAAADAPAAMAATFASSGLSQAFEAGAFTGRGKAVVVIDDGFLWSYDQSHTVSSFDFSGRNDADAAQNTLYSHGSWVAQVVTSAAADVDIIHLKVFADGSGGAAIRDIEEALRWVVKNGAAHDVAAVNMSLGYGAATRTAATILSDEIAALDRMGVFTVVAAGNAYAGRESVSVLAADRNVIAVSATDASDHFAYFSQRHAKLTDIAALGVDFRIETLDGRHGYVSGTSFSAPYVAAAAAVLQEAAETVIGERLTDDEFIRILQQSGEAVAGVRSASGYRVADIDAAVDWFLDHAAMFGTPVDLVA